MMALGVPLGASLSAPAASAGAGPQLGGVHIACGPHLRLDIPELAFKAGALTALVGPNGVGKSTLMRVMAGLAPARARFMLGGVDLLHLKPALRARQIAYLPQQAQIHWPLSVREIVGLGGADAAAVAHAMAQTGVEAFYARAATDLSGGEQARVVLARFLASSAPVLLADEPIAALDPAWQLRILALLRARAQAGVCAIVVLHDLTLAARFADEIVLLSGGRVLAQGPAETVFTPQLLAHAYGIEAQFPVVAGHTLVVPWQPL